jgi:uncharacterized circularly permuted ATP-grasp superfamily protein/uncharacterized alpha-E superfamily protein
VTSSYDEMVTGTGSLRPHWRGLMEAIWALPPEQLVEKRTRIAAQLSDDDEALAVPGLAGAAAAPSRSLDLLPLILPEAEWTAIAAGMAQRARLLDMILADLYGAQRLIEDRRLPPYLVLGNPAFLRPLRRVAPVRNLPHLYFYAADLVRLPSGEWRVFADRTQAPAGVGYALHTRSVLARTVPEMFRAVRVRRLQSFIELWQSSLRATGSGSGAAPRIVLLTPGPYNDAYFEHVFLARALGIALVQSADLTVRGNVVYLKTLEGLVKVDVVYRRVDGDYCDSLELREDSALGVAGLVGAARAGQVAIVNMPGSAAVETPAFAPFLPELAHRLLGEDLRLPAVTTWWCGQAHALAEVRARLDAFALHSVFDPAPQPTEPTLLSRAARAAFEARLALHPERFVAREKMTPSMAPCLDDPREERRFTPRPVVLRVMAVWRDGEWIALPGGVARVVRDQSIYRHRWYLGGIAKDVWVLSEQDRDGAVPAPLLPAVAVRAARQDAVLRSRTADNLYWVGRYVERLDAGARQFVAALQRLSGGGLSAREQAELQRLAEALRRTGWINTTVAAAPVDSAAFLEGVISAARDGTAMRDIIDSLRRLTLEARDHLSPAMWRTLHRLTAAAAAEFGRTSLDPDRVLQCLDGTIVAIAAFAGFAAESMMRGAGWRFLDLGRRIERAIDIALILRGVMTGPANQAEAGLRLALELCDSTNAYRLSAPAEGHYAQALDFVLAEPDNPRSLLHQLLRIEDHLGIQAALGRMALEAATVPALIAAVKSRAQGPADDLARHMPALAVLLDRAVGDLMEVSDSVTRAFFTHVASAQLLGFSSPPLLEEAMP